MSEDVAGEEPARTAAPAEATADDGVPTKPSSDPRLDELRQRIEAIDELPVSERLAAFDELNAELASELAALDEL